jgi:murein DD-endopeptidase MepM/ murein hydrolase activator NlpD
MTRSKRRRFFRDDVLAPWIALLVILGFWWLGARLLSPITEAGEEPAAAAPVRATEPTRTEPERRPATGPAPDRELLVGSDRTTDIRILRARNLLVPVPDVEAESLVSHFDQKRGSSVHEALDILAPRGTAVRAADHGHIARLFTSVRGGLTVYQFDATGTYCYYYAHLDRYQPGLAEGDVVQKGHIIGYVGTTGNAPPDTPHLHFAIFRLGPDRRWWEGTPLDPYLVLRRTPS